MKNVLMSLLVLLLSVFSFNDIFAQRGQRGMGQGPAEGRRHLPDSIDVSQMVKHLSERLELSEQQSEEIAALSQSHFASARAKMKDQKREMIKKREGMQKAKREFEEEVKALLDSDQKEKYEEIISRRREKPGQGRGRGGRR